MPLSLNNVTQWDEVTGKPGFDTGVVHEGFMVDIRTLGQGSVLAVWFINVICHFPTAAPYGSSWAMDPYRQLGP